MLHWQTVLNFCCVCHPSQAWCFFFFTPPASFSGVEQRTGVHIWGTNQWNISTETELESEQGRMAIIHINNSHLQCWKSCQRELIKPSLLFCAISVCLRIKLHYWYDAFRSSFFPRQSHNILKMLSAGGEIVPKVRCCSRNRALNPWPLSYTSIHISMLSTSLFSPSLTSLQPCATFWPVISPHMIEHWGLVKGRVQWTIWWSYNTFLL